MNSIFSVRFTANYKSHQIFSSLLIFWGKGSCYCWQWRERGVGREEYVGTKQIREREKNDGKRQPPKDFISHSPLVTGRGQGSSHIGASTILGYTSMLTLQTENSSAGLYWVKGCHVCRCLCFMHIFHSFFTLMLFTTFAMQFMQCFHI